MFFGPRWSSFDRELHALGDAFSIIIKDFWLVGLSDDLPVCFFLNDGIGYFLWDVADIDGLSGRLDGDAGGVMCGQFWTCFGFGFERGRVGKHWTL